MNPLRSRKVVNFALEKAPAYRVASIVRVGPWKEENLRTEFGELTRWAERRGVRTGHWIFRDRGHDVWEACLEIAGAAAPEGRIRLKTLAATWVARVTFDPDVVSSRVVYHGLNDWTRVHRRRGELRSIGDVREVYEGSPWSEPKAWSHCRVEFLVRRAKPPGRGNRTRRRRES